MPLIKKYEVRQWSGRSFEAPDEAFRILIVLYGEKSEVIGWLRFWEDTSIMWGDDETNHEYNFPFHCYHPVIDILRNEKPVYISYHGPLTCCMISTKKEPVGEEES